MTFALCQLILAFFNVINAYLDAYRILKHKGIAHAVNFTAYGAFTGLIAWKASFDIGDIVVFCIAAFFNRQLSFDIPLNLRRHLPAFYQSTANPPKAWCDKVERKLFGVDYDGKKIIMWYSVMFVFFVVVKTISLDHNS
jgi:hypothetical protein